MFWEKKKQDNFWNAYDCEVREVLEKMYYIQNELKNSVHDTITKIRVIDLYPEGADKEKAKKDAENAKYSLLCIIGTYDSTRQEYEIILSKNLDKRDKTKNWKNRFFTSHKLVEFYYANKK